ncbi:MAG: proton-conducting transporter membrane subunit [Solirubrobacteraceae bacterium]
MTATYSIAMAALALAPLLAIRFGRLSALASAAGCVLLVLVGLDAALGGARPSLDLGSWLGFGHSALRADGLAGIFLALTGVAGAATSIAYAELPPGRWLTALGGVQILAVAVAIGADNAFLLFLAWESLTVCIYLIASADRANPAELINGYLTAGITKIGGAALLAAFGLLYAHTHSFSLAVWTHASLPTSTRGVAFVLLLVAFGTKIGVVPVQGALPAGYGAAPRLGAASLSVALSAGFYGLWRFEVAILGPLPTWCGDTLLIIGTLTAVAGIAYAITRNDLRRFLGYSTIEQAGIVLLGVGVALLGQSAHNPTLEAVGLLAATLQVIAANLAKTLALIAVDRVEQASGERTMDPLGGLARGAPSAAAAIGLASLTLAAIPPLGGFVSEWFTFEALLQGFRMPTLLSQLLCALAAAALALTAGIGLLAFAKYYSFIFLGAPRKPDLRISPRAPGDRHLSLWLLAVVVLLLGTVAPWEIHAIGSGLHATLGFDPSATTISHPLVLGPVFANFSVLAPTWLSIVLPAYALLAFAIACAVGRRRVRRAPVWITGSGADLAAVQYRPGAYSNPMRVVLRGPLGTRTRLTTSAEDERQAGSAVLETGMVLAVDRFLYKPLTNLALAGNARVRRLQSGRLSTYLLYLMIALILALALIPVLR